MQHQTKVLHDNTHAFESFGRDAPGAGHYETVDQTKVYSKAFGSNKSVGQRFDRSKRVSKFESIMNQKDDGQIHYDFKKPSVTPTAHRFGGASRFADVRDKDRNRRRTGKSTSALDV